MTERRPRRRAARADPADQQSLGPSTSRSFRADPRRLVFVLSRYKFVAKTLAGYSPVLEVGCGDAFGTTIVAQSVERVVGIDVDGERIGHAADNRWLEERAELRVHDILSGPYPDETFAAAYTLDVIEHIEAKSEEAFLRNIAASLADHGVALVGTPNATAETYASEDSRRYHINLKTHDGLRETMARHFHHVFMFGMNDEVVHTGFGPMCHYLLALAVGPTR